jgi:molybdopterin molybdotransferase
VTTGDLVAPLNLPPFDSSAMDGYALRSADSKDGAELELAGASLAGHPFEGEVQPGTCIRITTGAAVPATADTVVIQENCDVTGERIRLIRAPVPGANIRPAGHDVRQGEVLYRAGTRLGPFDLAWMAACGIADLQVRPRPRIAIFSTGDELVAPGGRLSGGQIFDANREGLRALLRRLPVEVSDLGIIPDDRDSVAAALEAAARDHHLLLTSGGVSVGDADWVREVVEDLGRLDLWRLNLKPGKPLAFGSVGKALFLGLPGNPVSTIVTYLLIARPLILKLAGSEPVEVAPVRARLTEDIAHSPGREEYQRGILEATEDGLGVRTTGDQSSNRLGTFRGANCLIRVPKDAGNLKAGEWTDVLPFRGLLD